MMTVAGDLLCDCRDFRKLHCIARACILPKSVPGGHAVKLDLAVCYRGFEEMKRFSNTAQELHFRNFTELSFRIMKIENINTIDSQIRQAARQLILQKTRGDAMAARGDILGVKNSALDIFVEKVLIGVGRHFGVGRKVTSFRAHNYLIA